MKDKTRTTHFYVTNYLSHCYARPFGSVQLKVIFTRSENPIAYTPHRLSQTFSPVLPLKRFQRSSDWLKTVGNFQSTKLVN